jgi:hypothetical protein
VPHAGKVIAVSPRLPAAAEIASGAPRVVDVEFGRDCRHYALSQGIWTLPPDPRNAGAPASPDTGSSSVSVAMDGSWRSGWPRSPDVRAFARGNAYVVTLTGMVLKISGI